MSGYEIRDIFKEIVGDINSHVKELPPPPIPKNSGLKDKALKLVKPRPKCSKCGSTRDLMPLDLKDSIEKICQDCIYGVM